MNFVIVISLSEIEFIGRNFIDKIILQRYKKGNGGGRNRRT